MSSTKARKKKLRSSQPISFSSYLFRVLKQVHRDLAITGKAMKIMDDFMKDIFTRLTEEAVGLVKLTRKSTLTLQDFQTATRLILPGELANHAVNEANKAVSNFMRSRYGDLKAAGHRNFTTHALIATDCRTGKEVADDVIDGQDQTLNPLEKEIIQGNSQSRGDRPTTLGQEDVSIHGVDNAPSIDRKRKEYDHLRAEPITDTKKSKLSCELNSSLSADSSDVVASEEKNNSLHLELNAAMDTNSVAISDTNQGIDDGIQKDCQHAAITPEERTATNTSVLGPTTAILDMLHNETAEPLSSSSPRVPNLKQFLVTQENEESNTLKPPLLPNCSTEGGNVARKLFDTKALGISSDDSGVVDLSHTLIETSTDNSVVSTEPKHLG